MNPLNLMWIPGIPLNSDIYHVRASKHMRIRILICENEHQYAKNLKNMRNSDFAY